MIATNEWNRHWRAAWPLVWSHVFWTKVIKVQRCGLFLVSVLRGNIGLLKYYRLHCTWIASEWKLWWELWCLRSENGSNKSWKQHWHWHSPSAPVCVCNVVEMLLCGQGASCSVISFAAPGCVSMQCMHPPTALFLIWFCNVALQWAGKMEVFLLPVLLLVKTYSKRLKRAKNSLWGKVQQED